MNEPPKYAYPYPAQGYYQGPPVMAPPQYYAPPPPRREPGFLEGWPPGASSAQVHCPVLQLYVVVSLLTSVAATPPSSSYADHINFNSLFLCIKLLITKLLLIIYCMYLCRQNLCLIYFLSHFC